ncbi:MAG: histidine--tRNA ligase [Candidatus Yanofskybacteria bacterium RIFCSPLOWO2_01_FULL_49_25]|uniref:Histidine--tRNA ligase n=1 Tax=Candidatus Yanofskybacteria bacterium RIFCSPLOWO2_01_FULL_49_25 TaxID=1802701 RepID=A0A1F8GUK4_9BACT|nr:MAG: histidine--tRNA ligase [Candidatus Yanofskybacteria bacterium RIFCSPLOWO2_01_FULL_49_25]
MSKQKTQGVQAPKGMHDILPNEQPYWQFVLKKAKTLLEDYGFERIDTPIIEFSSLFIRGVGEATDVVEKEMYLFKSKGGDQLALRPEPTAGICRSYIEHGMHVLPQPIQLWTFGPVFRHDNPQAGRYRQFHQIDLEIFGDDGPSADAQSIYIAYKILESLGLQNLVVQINSIGDQNCRPQYIKALKDYYRGRDKKLCGACQGRLKTNPLRLLDCKVETCREMSKDAPQILDYLDEDCKKHFKSVVEFLDEIKVPYLLDHRLVRGLDYYTRTTFEITTEVKAEGAAPLALAGGGRYDKLVALLGGPKTPATGWGMGMERVVMALKDAGITPPESHVQPKLFIAQLGEMGKRKGLVLFEEFRKSGITVRASFGRDSIKSQLKISNRLGIKYTLIMGQKEAIDDTVIVREMDSGVQETVPLEKVVELMKAKIKKDHESRS